MQNLLAKLFKKSLHISKKESLQWYAVQFICLLIGNQGRTGKYPILSPKPNLNPNPDPNPNPNPN